MPLLAKKATVTELYCVCMSHMIRGVASDKVTIVATCEDNSCSHYHKPYVIPNPWEDIVLNEYVEKPK